MDAAILFEEVQASGSHGVQKFLRGLGFVFLGAQAVNLLLQRGLTNGLTRFFAVGSVGCIIAGLLVSFRLITQVRTDGLYVRYAPLQPNFARYAWSEVREVYLRRFNALPEFGGWGLRLGPSGRGYIVPGEWGIQLVLTNGTRVLITTNRADEVSEVLRKLGRL